MLALEHVKYSRNDVCIVDVPSLSVGPGLMLQLEGANGSGKSTMIGLMCGLLQPEEGRIRWNGKPIDSADAGYRGNFAHVGHKYGIKGDLSAEENLEVHAGLFGGRIGATPKQALDRVGLARDANTPCSRLSAGQKRRVSLARLLVCKAVLWLLDEPFANLDEEGAEFLRKMLKEHLEHGMAVVSTHRKLKMDGLPAETYRMGE